MFEDQPLSLHFDASATGPLRDALLETPALFEETTPDKARLIIFGDDTHEHVDHNALYARWPLKCVCITETDTPTFRLPGLYAGAAQSIFTRGRVETINYLLSERVNANEEIKKLDPKAYEKTYLYSFMGGSNSWPRKRIFLMPRRQEDTVIEATNSYNHWADASVEREWKQEQRKRYAETMARSKFSLCPRGCGISSYRLFESMSLGVAPVIISDRWRPIGVIDWSFALFIKERHISRIDDIVRAHEPEWQERGRLAHSAYWNVLAPERMPAFVHRQLLNVDQELDERRETAMRVATRLNTRRIRCWMAFYGFSKHIALRLVHVTGAPMPVTLYQPVAQQLGRRDSA
jgi:hypothetical protein